MTEAFLASLVWPGLITVAIVSLLIMGRFAFSLESNFLKGYSFTDETVQRNNPAVGIRLASFLLALVVSFLGMMHPSGVSFWQDLNNVGLYALLAIAFLMISAVVNDKVILYWFSNTTEVVHLRNMSVAVVEAATYLATAFVMSGALKGWEGGFLTAIMWFAIGQCFLAALGFLYRACVRGVFTALNEHVVTEARAAGVKGIRLYVDEHNRIAQATYERIGMTTSNYLLFERVPLDE